MGARYRLKDLSCNSHFEVDITIEPSLFAKMAEIGLLPGRTFTVLFQLANGIMIIGNHSMKIAIDSFTAASILVTLV